MGPVVNIRVREDFVSITCYLCGVLWAVPEHYDDKRRQDHNTFYCPNGHSQAYTGKSEAEKLKEQLADRDRQLAFERERAARNQAAREKAEAEREKAKRCVQKLEVRAAAGVCTCCGRQFANVERHMKSKHPEVVVKAKKQRGAR